jgi:4-aminobutyrate aminotransferase
MDRLQQLKEKYPTVIADIRGLGLMIGMEISNGDGANNELCMLIVALCESRGVHLTYTYFEPVIRFLPALTISREEIDLALSVLDYAISTALKGNISVDGLLASNPYSRSFIERLRGRKTLRNIASRVYETSPKQWLQKIKELGK